MSSPLLLSVVICAYNHEDYIEDTVHSVWNQDYPHLELVVVDDASTDKTFEILTRLQAQSPIPMAIYRNEVNLGPNKTQKRVVSLANGDLLSFLASDDQFLPNRFSAQVAMFQADPELMIVYANGWKFKGHERLARLHDPWVEDLLHQPAAAVLEYLYLNKSPLFLQTVVLRKAFYTRSGGNDEAVVADDWVLNIRFFQQLVQAGKFAYLDQDVAYYRVHDQNIHKDFARQSQSKIEVIEKYTPDSLKPKALGNMYWNQGETAFLVGEFGLGLQYLLKSQRYRFKPIKLLMFLCKRLTYMFRSRRVA